MDECIQKSYSTKVLMRCTKINTNRYQLSEEVETRHLALSTHFRESLSPRIARKDIPVAIRFGTVRVDQTLWGPRACLGYPWGSLLSSKQGKQCQDISFKQLQYKGNKGDPLAGEAVVMFPECIALDDPINPATKCITP